MTNEELQELKALALNATPGPWFESDWEVDDGSNKTTVESHFAEVLHPGQSNIWPGGVGSMRIADCEAGERPVADAAFIAAANPAAILALIDEIADLRAALAKEAEAARVGVAQVQRYSVHLDDDEMGGFEVASDPNGNLCLFAQVQATLAQCAGSGGAKPTDISTRLREYASNPGYSHNDYADVMRTAADECERFYGGMVAWKETAQQKDRSWSASIQEIVDKRLAALSAKPDGEHDAAPNGDQVWIRYGVATEGIEVADGVYAEFRMSEPPGDCGWQRVGAAPIYVAQQGEKGGAA